MKNDLLTNKVKYNFYLYFHLIVAILYFIFFLYFFISKNNENFTDNSFRRGGYLFLIHSLLNLTITRLIVKKIRWTYILLNIIGGLLVVSVLYMIIQIISIYTNNIYVNFSLIVYSCIFIFMFFYLFFLNKIFKKTNNNEIENIGKPQ